MWRTRPSSDMVDGGDRRGRSWSSVRPSHFTRERRAVVLEPLRRASCARRLARGRFGVVRSPSGRHSARSLPVVIHDAELFTVGPDEVVVTFRTDDDASGHDDRRRRSRSRRRARTTRHGSRASNPRPSSTLAVDGVEATDLLPARVTTLAAAGGPAARDDRHGQRRALRRAGVRQARDARGARPGLHHRARRDRRTGR